MAPPQTAFAGLAPLARPSAATQTAPRCAAVRMAAAKDGDQPKKQSILDWVLSKTMPHQDEADEFGYEPYFQKSLQAREAAKKAEYEKENQNKGKGKSD